jgi:hypothetical protein
MDSANNNIKFRSILSLLLLIISFSLFGQSENSLKDYLESNTSLPAEKVYLHIDRPNYIQGDTIWFKAYTWLGFNQIPDTISRVLYVDLLNPAGKIVQTRKLLIKNGISIGDLNLGANITPGRYIIRAYTRWMQNLNTGEPFYQTVMVGSVNQDFQVECNPTIIKQAGNDSLQIAFRFFELSRTGELSNTFNHKINYSLAIKDRLLYSGNVLANNTKGEVFKCQLSNLAETDTVAIFDLSIQDEQITYEKQFSIPLNDPVDLQFFPEGGKLVNGLLNKIAFKAIGTDGLSREITGQIRDEDGEVITNFKSVHRGMGAFLLKPESEKTYFAHLLYNKRLFIIPLPQASDEGCVMSVTYPHDNRNIYLTIRYLTLEADTQKYVVGSAYGQTRFVIPVTTTTDSCLIKCSLDLFPEGITRITVLDRDFKPECERLVYIDKNQRFKIEVKSDSAAYKTRSKVTLLIKVTDLGGLPVQTDLSLAVVDKGQILKNNDNPGICAYKLLESELQGQIEDVDYYFNNDSLTDRNALDLLLLTQGYRKFLTVKMKSDETKLLPERNFDITGKLQLSGNSQRVRNFNYSNIGLTLLSNSDKMYIELSQPDSLGKFAFHIPLQYGKASSLLQATNQRKKAFYGDILIDNLDLIPQFKQPQRKTNSEISPIVEFVNQLQTAKKAEISKAPWDTSMLITLGEVKVTARAKNWYRDFDKRAKKIVDLDSIDPTGHRYRNIYDLLVEEFGAKSSYSPRFQLQTILLPCNSVTKFSEWYPIYVINGRTYFDGSEPIDMFVTLLNNLSSFPVNEIKKLMVVPPGDMAAYYADAGISIEIAQSLVVIETYNDTFRGDPVGIKRFIINGLDAPRVFYSPHYGGHQRDKPIYDGRVTLLWEPSIRTDKSGEAKIEFFTSDRQADLEVIVNGIEIESGNPGQAKVLIGK